MFVCFNVTALNFLSASWKISLKKHGSLVLGMFTVFKTNAFFYSWILFQKILFSEGKKKTMVCKKERNERESNLL